MEKIGSSRLWSYFDSFDRTRPASNTQIRSGIGHPVHSYPELAKKVSELQFLNREHVLLFRGQRHDHLTTKGNSMLKAGIFRNFDGKPPTEKLLRQRFETLHLAESGLIQRYGARKLLGLERIRRHRSLRWAILQHYEVCPTPVLDVTHSLRIATSFASYGNEESDDAFLFVLGVPNISGAVTSSSEAGIQIIRLASACPPEAVRPHLQEGYLLGEYPEISDYDQNTRYSFYEMDFGRRLVAKFRFNPQELWGNPNFPRSTEKALYATQQADLLRDITESIRSDLKPGVQ